MEDSIQQYIKAAEDLRELIREAHEVLKDLRQETNSARTMIKKFEVDSAAKAEKRVKEAIEEIWKELKSDVLKEFTGTLDKAVDIINGSVDKHTSLIADRAETLALAMERQNPAAVRAVAAIARDTVHQRQVKRGKHRNDSADT